MPPEKKKKFSQHSEDSANVESRKNYEKDDSNTGPQRSSGTAEAIKFDEYMEGGIPDSLLKGLGFSESGQPGADDEASDPEEEEEADTPDSTPLHKDLTDDEDEDEEITRDDDDDDDYEERVPPEAVVKRKRGRPRGKAVPPRAAQRPSRDHHGGVKSPHSKAVIRGNIMYERMETGEVIASLVKNGAGSTPDGTGGYSTQARNSAGFGAVLNDLPSNCPIDENNVEDVLDRSIEETDVVRMALAALKDDLRRMGGGPHMTPYLKPVHVKKRIEIADRLLRVYCNYQTNINNISEMSRNPLSHVFPGNWTPVERARPAVRARRRGRGTGRSVGAECSARKVGSPVANLQSVVKQEPVNSAGAVSNDLWMSCEPGSEDEGAGQVGGARKHKKQSRDKAKAGVAGQTN